MSKNIYGMTAWYGVWHGIMQTNSAALQPFNPKKLLYSDYAQLPEAREKELNAEYSSLEDLVKYASSLNGFCRGLPLFMVKQAPKTSASQLCSSLR